MENNEPWILNSEWYKLLQAMRQTFSRSEYVKAFKKTKKSKKRGARNGVRYDCDICGKDFSPTQVEAHHTIEVIEIGKHYTEYTFDEFWHRLWCHMSELQLLCKKCHQTITDEQNEQRKNQK